MKNAFYFTLKSSFVLKIIKFLSSRFWSCREAAWLEILILKFVTSQPGKQTIAIHISHNISRSKAIRQWSLISQYNITTFFLEKHTKIIHVVETLFTEPFIKNQNGAYLYINGPKFYIVCFYCIPSWGLSKYIKTKLLSTCCHLIQRVFKKERDLALLSLAHFLLDFWIKIFLLLYSINWPNSINWLLLFPEKLGNMIIVIVC